MIITRTIDIDVDFEDVEDEFWDEFVALYQDEMLGSLHIEALYKICEAFMDPSANTWEPAYLAFEQYKSLKDILDERRAACAKVR